MLCRFYIAVAAMALSSAAYAQDGGVAVPPPVAPVVATPESVQPVASPAVPALVRIPAPSRTIISCDNFANYEAAFAGLYANAAAGQRLDRTLLDLALASYRKHHCLSSTYGPSSIVVVDFAIKSSEPRLWLIDLRSGKGVEEPVLVTHGIGSDPNDDGVIDWFGNIKDSLTSSIGAVRGAEVYQGKNGRSLRLDGLDPTNSEIRRRDIVVHSVGAKKRTYFNASYLADRGGIVGTSEGCFVVIPELRDWLIDSLSDGGFLYAGASGERGAKLMAAMVTPPVPVAVQAQVMPVTGAGQGSVPPAQPDAASAPAMIPASTAQNQN